MSLGALHVYLHTHQDCEWRYIHKWARIPIRIQIPARLAFTYTCMLKSVVKLKFYLAHLRVLCNFILHLRHSFKIIFKILMPTRVNRWCKATWPTFDHHLTEVKNNKNNHKIFMTPRIRYFPFTFLMDGIKCRHPHVCICKNILKI